MLSRLIYWAGVFFYATLHIDNEYASGSHFEGISIRKLVLMIKKI